MRSLAIDSSLEGIAGTPLAMLTVPNTSSSPLDIGPTEARTLYAVASTSALSNYDVVVSLGIGPNGEWAGAQVIYAQAKGGGGLTHGAQVVGGAVIYQHILTGWPWNKPLAVCGWGDGSRFGSQGYLSAPAVGAPSAVGSMNTAPRLRLAPISANGTRPITALAYRGVHDLATRTLILTRLMQRYGSL